MTKTKNLEKKNKIAIIITKRQFRIVKLIYDQSPMINQMHKKKKTIKNVVSKSPIAKIPVSAPEKAPAIKRETVSIVESAVRSVSMAGERIASIKNTEKTNKKKTNG